MEPVDQNLIFHIEVNQSKQFQKNWNIDINHINVI